MKRWWIMMCFVALATSAALAQQKTAVASTPSPTDSGPSLEVAMRSIQDRLATNTSFSYTEVSLNTTDYNFHSNTYKHERSNINADPSQCTVTVQEGPVSIVHVPLREVQQIYLTSYERDMTEAIVNSARIFGDQKRVVTSTNPPLTMLVFLWPKSKVSLPFKDLSLADQAARELSYAVRLCGGGKDSYHSQAPVPPPPDMIGSGPAFDATMSFIQDKLNDIRQVTFRKNHQAGTDGSVFDEGTTTEEISSAFADQSQCYVSYHRKLSMNGSVLSEADQGFSLRDVQDIAIEPYAQYVNEASAKLGSVGDYVSTSPPVTALLVNRPHGVWNLFPFTDAVLVDRVAKAMVHAVELCGGGGKPEPF